MRRWGFVWEGGRSFLSSEVHLGGPLFKVAKRSRYYNGEGESKRDVVDT